MGVSHLSTRFSGKKSLSTARHVSSWRWVVGVPVYQARGYEWLRAKGSPVRKHVLSCVGTNDPSPEAKAKA